MSLLSHIVLTAMLVAAAVSFMAVAIITNDERLQWIGFGLAMIAQSAWLDVRARWRLAAYARRREEDEGTVLRAVR